MNTKELIALAKKCGAYIGPGVSFHLHEWEAFCAALSAAQPKADDCGICHGNPEACDVHDCGDAHKKADERGSAEPHPPWCSGGCCNPDSAQARDAALEEAAQAVEKGWPAWDAVAAAVRALKGKQ
jgi:hypothetical protein